MVSMTRSSVLYLLIFVVFWPALYVVLGDEGLPGGNIFAIAVTVVSGHFLGCLFAVIHIPPLLGMLVAGFCLRNIPGIDVARHIDPDWSAALRSAALTVILARAGLGVNVDALLKLRSQCLKLSLLPNLVEAVCVAFASVILFQFSWTWGFMLGFIISAVSPAVVVPSLIALQDQGYGVEKGIPSLVLAAASFDDVLSISGFGVFFGIVFSQGFMRHAGALRVHMIRAADLSFHIIRGPLELFVGVALGILLGTVFANVAPVQQLENARTTRDRGILMLFLSYFVIVGGKHIHLTGAGALAVVLSGVTSSLLWKRSSNSSHPGNGESSPGEAVVSALAGVLKSIWLVAQPFLFSLIGAAVDLDDVKTEYLTKGCILIIVCVLVRTCVTVGAAHSKRFHWREEVFIALAWMPKATVQAALGAIALDEATAQGLEAGELRHGIIVLTVAVLSILITAPIGAAAIAVLGPRLLEQQYEQFVSAQSQSESSQGEQTAYDKD